MSDYDDLVIRFDIVIEYKGRKVLDPKTVNILRALKEKESFIEASKALGISYSKLRDIVAKIENIAGRKIVEVRRGGRRGGGVILTDFGEKLLTLYEVAWSKLLEAGLATHSQYIPKQHSLVIAHGYDPILNTVFSLLSSNGTNVKGLCVGSGISIAMLALNSVDAICIHLYDPETGIYNRPYLERLWLSDRVEHLGGYMREMVFAFSPTYNFKNVEEIVEGILRGELVVASRNRGSGTRILLEALLKEYANKQGVDIKTVRGIDRELYTHDDVAKHIMYGVADVGLVLRYIADKYSLKYVHVTWESYECYALKSRINSATQKFSEIVNSRKIRDIILSTPGYRLLG